jgi:hypothetical protein
MVARVKNSTAPLWIVFARAGTDVKNDLAMSGEEACQLACIMLAGIGTLEAGDALRVISAGATVDGAALPPAAEETVTIRPFSKIEAGLDRARQRQAHWRHVAACFEPGSREHVRAKVQLDLTTTYIAAETALLAWLRRRLALYTMFPAVERPADLQRYLKNWTDPPPPQPPTQLRMPF